MKGIPQKIITTLSEFQNYPVSNFHLKVRVSTKSPPPIPCASSLLYRKKFRGAGLECAYWQLPGRSRYRLYWSDAGTFDIDGKSHLVTVTAYPIRNARGAALEEVLRGPVCSFLLLEQGFEPLHASSVIWQGQCIAFAGRSGAGKSSLCAYLQGHGGCFFSDDVLPLRRVGGIVRAYPGLPHLRLNPDTVAALGIKRRYPILGKLNLSFRHTSPRRQPLSDVYLLQRRKGSRGAVRRRRLGPREAFTRLVSLTRNQAQAAMWRMENQLRILGWIAANIPVWTLQYPSRFSAWAEIRELLQAPKNSAKEEGSKRRHSS